MSHREHLDELIDAWNTGDADKATALYDEKVRFRDSANPSGIVGKKELSEYLAWLNSISPDTTFDILEVEELEDGDEFLVRWRYFVPDGLVGQHQISEVDGIQYLAFFDGKLVRSECFYDQIPLLSEIFLSSRICLPHSTGLT